MWIIILYSLRSQRFGSSYYGDADNEYFSQKVNQSLMLFSLLNNGEFGRFCRRRSGCWSSLMRKVDKLKQKRLLRRLDLQRPWKASNL